MIFTDNQLDTIHGILDKHQFQGSKSRQVYFAESPTRTLFSYCQSLAKEIIDVETDVKNLKGYGSEKELARKLSDYLKTIPYKITLSESVKVFDFKETKRIADLVSNFKIFHSVRVGDLVEKYSGKIEKGDIPFIIYDSKKDEIIDATQNSINSILNAMGISKKVVVENIDTLEQVYPVFDPYITDRFFIRNHLHYGDFAHINLYTPPSWRKREVTPELRGFFKSLIEHIFVVPEERDYIYLWLKTAILGRNETILYLRGSRAIGKSIFASLLAKLIGREYSAYGKKEDITKQFNKVFNNNRAIIFEEVHFEDSPDSIDRLKAFCNDRVAIESKGKDSYTAINYSSILFCVNKNRRSGITPSERRFSIPKITDRQLSDSILDKEISKYKIQLDLTEHEEWFDIELAEFGQFLINFKSDIYDNTLNALRGEAFQQCCEENLREWQKDIIKYILEEGSPGKAISFKELIKATRTKKGPGRPVIIVDGNISEFISDYLHKSKYRLGEIVGGISGDPKYGGELYLVPNEVFLKTFGKTIEKPKDTDDLFNLL